MATWLVGDIHGCFETFLELLQVMEYRPQRDRLFLAGDLVNKGPRSLEMLRWASEHREVVSWVLGNHDLTLLAKAWGVFPLKPGEPLQHVVDAPDAADLLDWMRRQPVLVETPQFRLAHAGIHPLWTAEEARCAARHVEQALGGEQAIRWLETYRRREPWAMPSSPQTWDQEKPRTTGPGTRGEHGYGAQDTASDPASDPATAGDAPSDRGSYEHAVGFALHTFTRMRILLSDGALNLDFTEEPDLRPARTMPWFAFTPVDPAPPVVFGHWAAVGYRRFQHAVCLDSGCVYGGTLTALRWDDGAVRQMPVVDRIQRRTP